MKVNILPVRREAKIYIYIMYILCTSDDLRIYECAFDGTSKPSGLYGYHYVGYKVDDNAIILHDAVFHALV